MKKKFNDKLALNRETLRTLTGPDMMGAVGGFTQGTCGTGASNPTDTCATCVGPSCHGGATTTTAGSSCC